MAISTFAIYDADGVPVTTATPTFLVFSDVDGDARTPPADPVHIGSGLYTFTTSQEDSDVGTVAVVDAGATNTPRYNVFSFHPNERPIHAFAFYNSDGTLWAGDDPPTIGLFDDLEGNPQTPPALKTIEEPFLYALKIPEADFVDGGRAYRIDAVAGAVPAFYAGSIDGFVNDNVDQVPTFPYDWSDFEDAIQAQVKVATGFDGAHVIWANQTRNRPTRPFIELDIVSSQETVGELSEETIEVNPDSDGEDGAEMLAGITEHVELMVQFRVYSQAVTGNLRAVHVARRLSLYFATTACQDALGEIVVVDRNPVRDATLVLETEHEGRAMLDIRFRVADRSILPATVIETVPVETTVTQTSGDVTEMVVVTLEE